LEGKVTNEVIQKTYAGTLKMSSGF